MADETVIVKTGTPGLDELFGIGGFKQRSSILVSGEPGAGKSILALQFIYNGARLHGEAGVYVTSEQSSEKVRENAKSVGMDLKELEDKGLIKLIRVRVSQGLEITPDELMKEVKKSEVKRVVIDSITPLQYLSSNQQDFRTKVLSMIEVLTGKDVTVLVTAEKRKTDFDNVEFSPEAFLFDGVILMGRTKKAVAFERVLSVVKMRGTKHSEELHPIEISNAGLAVNTLR